MTDHIAIIDFGGQYCHLISRRIRELGVATKIFPAGTSARTLRRRSGLKGIILSGGAISVYEKKAPRCDRRLLTLGVPVLGICYGHQLIAHLAGGKVAAADSGEYGVTELNVKRAHPLLRGCKKIETVWMNHRDIAQKPPRGSRIIASTAHTPVAAFAHTKKRLYGVQFHPEVSHTTNGKEVLESFVRGICKAEQTWRAPDVIKQIVRGTKRAIGTKKAVVALSGGLDSSVAAMLAHRAIGNQLTAVYVDTGMMRHRETAEIRKTFSALGLPLRVVHAHKIFFKNLKGVVSPERKRKIIGKTFIDIFRKIARQQQAQFLIQGTIYSDRIESGLTKHSSSIKSHHNVGGLPKNIGLEIHEPLREFYKDEIRRFAAHIGLPEAITKKHVFPGSGLAIRVLGEVTPAKTRIARKASHIIEEVLRKTGHYDRVWMAFAVLLPVKSVGIQGDQRSYKYPVVVRIVESKDAMTANVSRIPYRVLEQVSSRITNEIKHINRVVYDISHKPPATMEWE